MIFTVSLPLVDLANVRYAWLANGAMGSPQSSGITQVGTFSEFRINSFPPSGAEEIYAYDVTDPTNYSRGHYQEIETPEASSSAPSSGGTCGSGGAWLPTFDCEQPFVIPGTFCDSPRFLDPNAMDGSPCAVVQFLEPRAVTYLASDPDDHSAEIEESGVLQLTVGTSLYTVVFGTGKIGTYSFDATGTKIVDTLDGSPVTLTWAISQQTANGFTVLFNQSPPTANYAWDWLVRVAGIPV